MRFVHAAVYLAHSVYLPALCTQPSQQTKLIAQPHEQPRGKRSGSNPAVHVSYEGQSVAFCCATRAGWWLAGCVIFLFLLLLLLPPRGTQVRYRNLLLMGRHREREKKVEGEFVCVCVCGPAGVELASCGVDLLYLQPWCGRQPEFLFQIVRYCLDDSVRCVGAVECVGWSRTCHNHKVTECVILLYFIIFFNWFRWSLILYQGVTLLLDC